MSLGDCSSLIDEWNPAHRQAGDGVLAVATDYGGEGRINPVWSTPIISRLMQNGRSGMVELSYPNWLTFLDRVTSRGRLVGNCTAFWPDLHEIKAQRDVARDPGLGRLRRTPASVDSSMRHFKTDVLTVVELFRALVAWRVPDQASSLYERHGVQSALWAHQVACVSCPTIWMVTDPELPLTLMSDRPGLYELLESHRRRAAEFESTRIARVTQGMTIDTCIASVYPNGDLDWTP